MRSWEIDDPDDVYRHGRWHAYLDHMMQANLVFATAESAVRWLAARVDVKRAA